VETLTATAKAAPEGAGDLWTWNGDGVWHETANRVAGRPRDAGTATAFMQDVKE
jgi:hypothetical protein